jgi:cytochrome c
MWLHHRPRASRRAFSDEGAKMKSIVLVAIVAAGIAVSGAANASEALAKSSGCATCHDVATKKMGPSYKDIAAKYKGKADAEKTLVTALSTAKGHPEVKAKGDDLKGIVKWVLSL